VEGMMKNLISKLNKNAKIVIQGEEYIVKTKTWYSIEEDRSVSYVKCELSNDQVLVVIPDDELMYIGKVIENMNYERILKEKIKYNGVIFDKTGDGHQYITKIEFGEDDEVEGKCVFEDYEAGNNIISLGILTDKNNVRADVYADIINMEEVEIK